MLMCIVCFIWYFQVVDFALSKEPVFDGRKTVPRMQPMDRCILTACPPSSQRRVINPPTSRPGDHALALPLDCAA